MSDYRANISKVVENGYVWVDDFVKPLHEYVREELEIDGLNGLLKDGAPDPFYVDTHLSDLGLFLESVALFRSQYLDLEERAVKSALEYDLARKNNAIARRIETSRYSIDRSNRLSDLSKGIASLASSDASVIAKYVESYFLGSGELQSVDAKNAGEVIELIQEKWDNVSVKLDELEARHASPGHALNYAERAGKLRALLIADLKSAIRKYHAVRVGLNLVYGTEIEVIDWFGLPDADLNLVDHMMHWHRRMSRLVANIRMHETELTFTFGASIPRLPVYHYGPNKPQLSYDEFISQLKNGDLELSPDPWLGNFKNVRVLGAAVSFVIGPDADIEKPNLLREFQNIRTRVLLIPPEQKGKAGADDIQQKPIQRKPVLFDDVGLDMGPSNRHSFESGVSLFNIDPRGVWRVSLQGWMHSHDDGGPRDALKHIRDIRISLRIRATYDREAAFSFGTNPGW